MSKFRALVVDNEVGMLEVCGDILNKLPDAEIVLESNSLLAAEMLKTQSWDLLISDIRMPGMSGIELMRVARENDSEIATLIITAYPSLETAVESMKLGASDYLTKPFMPDDLLATVQRLLNTKRLKEENTLLRRQVERPYTFGEMIGQSAEMHEVFDIIKKIAGTSADVLITGETGTGKELVARSIHQNSERSEKRFVPVDCGAIPDELLESEFFGHEKGAFTGAHTKSLGLMEFAHEGTLFLDEIGELPLRLQAKLLRTLQERTIRRVGGTSETEVNVRIIAATARDLDKEIRDERFRSDLYYRVNVVEVKLPPLRERKGDIRLLSKHFVQRYGREMKSEGAILDGEALDVLAGYAWPGNVRELQNIVKRVLATSTSEIITVDELPDEIVNHSTHISEIETPGFFGLRENQMVQFEREYFITLLKRCNGDMTRAAKEAQLPRGTLYRLLSKHELTPADFRS